MSRGRTALLVVLALGAAACGGSENKRRAETEEAPMEWNGAFCNVSSASERVVRTAEEWRALWTEIGKPAPEADLNSHFAVAVFLGARNTGGYGVSFEKPIESAAELRVPYRVKAPGEMMVIQALTQPYAVRLYPRRAKAVRVEALGE